MTTPIWFLDVDGVVNAAGVDLPDHLIRTEATTAGTTWPIHYSPEVIEFINMIHRSRLAEIRWLTTWGSDARKSLAPAVGLDEFTAYEMYDSTDWWKAEIVAGSIADEERPIIWTDDDITDEGAAWFRDSVELPTLIIAPAMELGLVSADLRRITDFLTNAPNPRTVAEPHLPGALLMTAMDTWSNAQLFEQYSTILRELRRRTVIRTNNAPAGDYAEWLVHRALGGRIAPNAQKSYDIETRNGTLVQVKARVVSTKINAGQRQMSPFRSWDFHQAALVQFSEHDYSIVRAVLVPVDEVRTASAWRSHVNGSIAHMTEALMTSPGSEDITDAVRAAATATEGSEWS